MRFKRLIYGSLLSLSLFTTASLFSVVAATNGIQKVYTGKECLAAEFDKITGATSYTAYIKGEDITSYQQIDSQLVRVTDDKVRVDAVGLKAGTYSLKFESNNSNSFIELTDITVEADDRSGYAHFNYTSGVGAYKDDGTLKDNTVVVYVNEDNKNDVTASIYNTEKEKREVKTGLANILKAQRYSNEPLDIRIIGTIGASTWNQIEYDPNGTYRKNKNLPIENVIGQNNVALPHQNLDESAIIDGEYNSLNTSTYSKLNGLTNKIIYNSDDNEFDSYYNMLDIEYVSNVTVEGIGDNAKIEQWGFTWKKSNSIEVRNLTFNNYPEDACAFQGADTKLSNKTTTSYNIDSVPQGNIWVHNNTFNQGKNVWDVCQDQDKHEGDGATDVKYQKDITYSYNHYYENHKTGLVGGSENNITANVTFHHNWYHENQSRMPFARQANMHMYNNYYDSSTGTTMQIYAGAYAFIENCYFKDDNKTFELNNKGYTTPAIKSFNNTFDGSETTTPATIVSSRTESVSNGNIFYKTINSTTYNYSSFDTESNIFYYDSTKNESKVTIMNSASELPTLIPQVAGAGKLNEYTIYSVTGEEEVVPALVYDNTSIATYLDEDFGDSTMSITKTASTPENKGLYYKITDDIDSNDYNNVTIINNRVKVYDNSGKDSIGDGNSRTTNAYYMFGSDNYFSSGIVKYSLDIEVPVNSSWKIISFINNSNKELALYSDSNKHLAIRYDGSETAITTSVYTAGTYHVVLEIDYSNNKLSLSVGENKATITNYTSGAIKGLLFTTSANSARTYYFDNVKIAVNANLKLGYQLGSYTKNNTKYNALRIIGKIEYDDIYKDLDSIDSVTIDVIVEDANGNQTKSVSQEITNIYKSLKISNGDTITDVGPKLRYYYTVVRGITSSYIGYKIKATSTINLKNGVKVECSGFTYEIQ